MSMSLTADQVLYRNNVRVSGPEDGPALIFVHGFATDQRMWRHIAPSFEADHRVVLIDLVGAGESDLTAYDPLRYRNCEGYAHDLVEVAQELDLRDAVLVGHSFGAVAGVTAQPLAPERFSALALIGPSARYLDDPATGYVGGLTQQALDELLDSLESNFYGWANQMAPAIMANPERPELARELAETLCGTDPEIAARWAQVTFTADIRGSLAAVTAPVVVLQCTDDPMVPLEAGRWMAEHLPQGRFEILAATGHCPHLSAPEATLAAIKKFISALGD